MLELIEKLVKEKADLYVKLVALRSFIPSEKFSQVHPVQQVLLQKQLEAMTDYHRILLERIEHLEEQLRDFSKT